ncbi:MAG: hypothetical protein Q9218_003379 [Villophora microphyllina]
MRPVFPNIVFLLFSLGMPVPLELPRRVVFSLDVLHLPPRAAPANQSESITATLPFTLSQEEGSGMEEPHEKPNPVRHKAVMTHGILMGIAFVVFFPAGAILIRLLRSRNTVWIHAATQIFAYVLALTGLGLGVYIAVYPEKVINTYHPIIGLIVIGLFAIQPILALIQHAIWKKEKRRTWWAVAHVWLGRVVLTLGMINGGLGLMLSDNTTKGEIGYGVVAAVVWLTWAGVAVWSEVKKASGGGPVGENGMGERKEASPDGTEDGKA